MSNKAITHTPIDPLILHINRQDPKLHDALISMDGQLGVTMANVAAIVQTPISIPGPPGKAGKSGESINNFQKLYFIGSSLNLNSTYFNGIILASGTIILVLPPTITGPGVITFKNVGKGSITIKTNQKIDNSTSSVILAVQNQYIVLFSDQSNWWIIGNN